MTNSNSVQEMTWY